jgi:hypothetical protein
VVIDDVIFVDVVLFIIVLPKGYFTIFPKLFLTDKGMQLKIKQKKTVCTY